MEKLHLFVVGVGRSGTTLVQAMLNSHSHISMMPEINYVRRYLVAEKLNSWRKSSDLGSAKRELELDHWLQRLPFSLSHLLEEAWGEQQDIDPNLYLKILTEFSAVNQTRIVGDKDPKSIEWGRYLLEKFPGLKLIHVVRDPRDVLVSKSKAEWSRNRSYAEHLLAHAFQLNQFDTYSQQFESRIFTLRYEDLLSTPEDQLHALCKFLGVPYEAEMQNHSHHTSGLIAEEETQWKGNINKPIISGNTGKWRNELPDRWQQLTEIFLGEQFSKYGYIKESNCQLNVIQKLLLVGMNLILRLYTAYRRLRE